jgi:hypothetical protein
MLSKIWANGLVIIVAALFSLWLVVQWWLQVPIAGSIVLFVAGAILYQFTVTALGIFFGDFYVFDGPVRIVGDTRFDGYESLIRNYDSNGKHAGLALGG